MFMSPTLTSLSAGRWLLLCLTSILLCFAPENLMAQSINGVWVGSINDGDTHYLKFQDNEQCLLDQAPQCLRQEYADQPSCSYSTDDGKTYTVNLCKQDGKFVLQVQLVQECCSLDGTWSSEKLSESGEVSLAKTTPCVAPQ